MLIRTQNKMCVCNLENMEEISIGKSGDDKVFSSQCDFLPKEQIIVNWANTKRKNVPLRFWTRFAIIMNLMKTEFSRCRRCELISERDIKILDFLFKQDHDTLTDEDWNEMDKIQNNNPNWDTYKKATKLDMGNEV